MSQTRIAANRSCLFLALVLLLGVSSTADAQTTLRWKFEPGQVLNQVIEQDMTMAMKVGEQNISTGMKQTVDAVWKVGEVDGQGVAAIAQEFTRIRMKMAAPGGAGFDFDSSQDQQLAGLGAVMAPALKALAKSKFNLRMTPRGEIVDVEVSQQTIDALKSIPGAAQLGGMFSKEGLINMIKQGAQKFPKEPIQPGAKWTNTMESELPQLGTMSANSKLTYAGAEVVDGKMLERINLDVNTKIVPKPGAALAQVSIKDQMASGVLYFDNEAGRLSQSELNQKMTIEISVAGNNISQGIDQTVKVRVMPPQN